MLIFRACTPVLAAWRVVGCLVFVRFVGGLRKVGSRACKLWRDHTPICKRLHLIGLVGRLACLFVILYSNCSMSAESKTCAGGYVQRLYYRCPNPAKPPHYNRDNSFSCAPEIKRCAPGELYNVAYVDHLYSFEFKHPRSNDPEFVRGVTCDHVPKAMVDDHMNKAEAYARAHLLKPYRRNEAIITKRVTELNKFVLSWNTGGEKVHITCEVSYAFGFMAPLDGGCRHISPQHCEHPDHGESQEGWESQRTCGLSNYWQFSFPDLLPANKGLTLCSTAEDIPEGDETEIVAKRSYLKEQLESTYGNYPTSGGRGLLQITLALQILRLSKEGALDGYNDNPLRRAIPFFISSYTSNLEKAVPTPEAITKGKDFGDYEVPGDSLEELIARAQEENRFYLIRDLRRIFPREIAKLMAKHSEDWSRLPSWLVLTLVPDLEPHLVPGDKLAALRTRVVRAEAQAEQLRTGEVYVRSVLKELASLSSRSAKLLALRTKARLQASNLPELMKTVDGIPELSPSQKQLTYRELSELRGESTATQKFVDSLIKGQLTAVERRRDNLVQELGGLVNALTDKYNAEARATALSAYVALYQGDRDLFGRKLSAMAKQIQASESPREAERVYRDLAIYAKNKAMQLKELGQQVTAFHADLQKGHATVLDLLAEGLLRAGALADPKLIQTLEQASGKVEQVHQAGILLQIEITALLEVEYGDFIRAMDAVDPSSGSVP